MGQQVGEDKPVATAVKHVVAEREECRPEDLGTLGYAVNVERLTNLVKSEPTHADQNRQSLTFQYCGYTIQIDSEGVILIES